tara:strand:+ start:254 stop:730 length:477 start_codon:yes stop_codon:yes gene_type:complete
MSKNKNILVIDANGRSALPIFLGETFRGKYAVHGVSSAQEGLDFVEQNPVDLAIIEYDLVGAGLEAIGYNFLKRLSTPGKLHVRNGAVYTSEGDDVLEISRDAGLNAFSRPDQERELLDWARERLSEDTPVWNGDVGAFSEGFWSVGGEQISGSLSRW